MVVQRNFKTAILNSSTILFFLSLFVLIGCTPRSDTQLPSSIPTNTFIPTDTDLPLPDLSIQSITIDFKNLEPCERVPEQIGIVVQIVNQGKANADSFIVKLNGTKRIVNGGLRPGESIAINFPNFREHSQVSIDTSQKVKESDEKNNNASYQLVVPTLAPECIRKLGDTPIVLQPMSIMHGHKDRVLSLDFSPDGKLLATGSIDNTLRLWRVRDAVLLRTMRGNPFPVQTLKFSHDGKRIATGSSDGLIRIWRVSDGGLIKTLKGHGGSIVDLEYSPDNRTLASCAEDYTVRIWREINGKQLRIIDEGMTYINDLSYSPNGKLLAWGEENGRLRMWDVQNNNWHLILQKSQPVRSIAFSPEGDIIAAGYGDGIINLWKVSNGNLIDTLMGHTDGVSSLSFSPDGKWLVSGSDDGTLRVWAPYEEHKSNFSAIYLLEGHQGAITAVEFSPDGELIASSSDDMSVILWSFPDD
jgi:WD40 repeat protein